VLRARYEAQTAQVEAVELGTLRALSITFGSKGDKLPKLPTFDELLQQQGPAAARIPAWMKQYEAVNKLSE